MIDRLITLVKDSKLEISDGIWLNIGEQISVKIFQQRDDVMINFDAPFPYIHVTKLGIMKLANLVKPRVTGIAITPRVIRLEMDGLPSFEVDRNEFSKTT